MALILVIDDDPSIRAAVQALLERQGMEVLVADSGAAGISYLEAFTVDVAIVDIIMPGMDGLEIIRACSRRIPRVPVIAMSGGLSLDRHGAAPDFLRMAGRLGARTCLRKPFRPNQVMAAIGTCLAAESGADAAVISTAEPLGTGTLENFPAVAGWSRLRALEA
jgi:CheY-like chemotaxis protein